MAERRTFRRTLLTGVFIILPLAVTLWFLQFIFSAVDRALTPAILRTFHLIGLGEWSMVAWVKVLLPIASIATAVLFTWMLGLVGGNVVGRQVVEALERLVLQIPVVRSIYSAIRQFVDTFSSGDGRSFSRVVLVEWPKSGSWTIGLVTQDTTGEIRQKLGGKKLLTIYVPTTPNPTGGYLIFVEEDAVKPLSLTVDEALKMVISLGVLGGDLQDPVT